MIEAEKATYTVKRMCALLGVSRSGFYQWRVGRDRGPTRSQRRRAELDAEVAASHAASDGVYGAPRILADLRAAGARVSRKTGSGVAAPAGPGPNQSADIRARHHGGRPGRTGSEGPGGAAIPYRRAGSGVDVRYHVMGESGTFRHAQGGPAEVH
jgi:hypothetical protein